MVLSIRIECMELFSKISTKPQEEIKKAVDNYHADMASMNGEWEARTALFVAELDTILFLHNHLKSVDLEAFYQEKDA